MNEPTKRVEVLSPEQIVEQLVAAGVPREKAEAEFARRPTPYELEKDRMALEKKEQWECIKLYRAYGCVVYETSQKRRAKVTPGLPDIRVFAPRVHEYWEHECKRQGVGWKGLSPDQKEYVRFAEECRLHVVVGDRFEAAKQLVTVGLAVWVVAGESIQPSRLAQGHTFQAVK